MRRLVWAFIVTNHWTGFLSRARSDCYDVTSDVGVNLCNVKSCLNTSNNEIFKDKRGDLPCVNISKHTCPVVK